MQYNPFNILPKINKTEAINILRIPISEVKFLADYYKAVFHLANFPSEESEIVLLEFIKYDYEKLLSDRDTKLVHFIGKDIVYFHLLFSSSELCLGCCYKEPFYY